jgi:hypothetical protein
LLLSGFIPALCNHSKTQRNVFFLLPLLINSASYLQSFVFSESYLHQSDWQEFQRL